MTNFREFGFAHFCTADEFNGMDQQVEREFEIPDGPQSTKVNSVVVSKTDLIPLPGPDEKKLVTHDLFDIISAGQEIAPVYLLSRRAGWNQMPEDLLSLVSRPNTLNLLAVYYINGIAAPLGSGMVLDTGKSTCWIGMLLVHPELRRQGIGLAVLKQCLWQARFGLKKKIIGLDATPLGYPVYKNIGFNESFRLWRCTLKTSELAPVARLDIQQAHTLSDYGAFAEKVRVQGKIENLELVRKINPEGCWVLMSSGKVVAILLSRMGRVKPYIGPLLAIDENAASGLLSHALNHWNQKGHSKCFLDIPENQFLTFQDICP
jgi:GNAT superfamily N-acetyltransferase